MTARRSCCSMQPRRRPPADAGGAQAMRDIGLNVDHQAMDWPTLSTRRASKNPLAQGGWSALMSGLRRRTCRAGWPFRAAIELREGLSGWPRDEAIENSRRVHHDPGS